MTERRERRIDANRRHSNLPADVVFDLLSDGRRRDVLQYLRRHASAAELQELVDWLEGRGRATANDPGRIVTSLHHVHLPRLEDAGVVTYDPDRDVIELEEGVDALVPYLDLAFRDDSRTGALDAEFSRGCE